MTCFTGRAKLAAGRRGGSAADHRHLAVREIGYRYEDHPWT
jgi:hypothetical protein